MNQRTRHDDRKYEEGSVSLVCLIVVLLALIVSLSVTTLAVDRIQCSRKVVNGAEALSIAEAGAEYTILQVRQSPSYAGTGGPVDFGDGSFTTTVTPISGGNLLIRSVGTLDAGGSRTVEIVMSRSAEAILPDGAIVSNGGVSLTGNASTHTIPSSEHQAHVRANENITMTGNSNVDGSIIAGGTVTSSPNVHCYDADYPQGQSGGPTLRFPSSTQIQSMADGWRSEAQAGGSRGEINLSGKKTLTITAPIYIDGDISLSANAVLNIVGSGKVYVTGNVSVSGNGVINNAATLITAGTFTQSGNGIYRVTGDPEKTAIVSLSTHATQAIKLTGNADASLMGLIYAARGGIQISGNGTIRGGLVSGSTSSQAVSANGNATIYYPASLIQKSEILPTEMRPRSWLER